MTAKKQPDWKTIRRYCTRCGEEYSAARPACPACRNPEFSLDPNTNRRPEMTATKTKSKAKPKSKPKKPAAAGAIGPAFGRIINFEMIAVGAIVPSPFQPRREFPDAEIEALADSLRRHGQLVPIVVREVPRAPSAKWSPSQFELIYGERRLRAARQVGLDEIRAEIVEADDAAVRRAILAETLERRGLNPIEEASALRMAIDNGDAAGPTELAAQLGLSQGHVSNRLRLLELPEWWQAKLCSGEITERHARAVLPLLDRPDVLAALEAALANRIAETGEAPTVAEWERSFIPLAVGSDSRVNRCTVGETDRALSRCDFPEITPVWDEAEPIDTAGERKTAATTLEPRSAGSRLWAWKRGFLSHAIAEQLRHRANEADLLKVALLMEMYGYHWLSETQIAAMAGSIAGGRVKKDLSANILGLDEIDTVKAAGLIYAEAFWNESVGPVLMLPAADVPAVAESLGVDLAEAWAAGDVPNPEAYWNDHTRDELLAIAKEVKLHEYCSTVGHDAADLKATIAACSKAELVCTFLRAMPKPDDAEAGIPMPREILKAKPPKSSR